VLLAHGRIRRFVTNRSFSSRTEKQFHAKTAVCDVHMAGPSSLIINMRFNPPEFEILGPVLESTVLKLGALLPRMTSLSRQNSRKELPAFQLVGPPLRPPHWRLELPWSVAHEVSQMQMTHAIIECVDEEGVWELRATTSFTSMEGVDHVTMIYVKRPKRKEL
jgi:hypothetical protein